MRRILIQIDDETNAWLRKRAFEEKRSIASIVRDCLRDESKAHPKLTIDDFKFVGAGGSEQGKLAPVSENHDDAYAEAISARWRRRK